MIKIFNPIKSNIKPPSFIVDSRLWEKYGCHTFKFDRETLSNPPQWFLDQVEERFNQRSIRLEQQCQKIYGRRRGEMINQTRATLNWFQKNHWGHFTDFISLEPPIFGCAALKVCLL